MITIDDDSGVPPLEDMTELLQQKSKASIVATSGSFKQAAAKTTTPVVSNIEQSLPQQQRKVTKDSLVFPTDNVHTITSATTPVSSKPVSASNPPSSSSFGGLKAGFFNSKPPTTTKKHDPASSTVEPVIEVVKPKQTKEDALRIDEVQEAMKSKLSLLEKQEWLTPDLLAKIDENPKLAKAFSDPAFAKAAGEVAKDPERAFAKYMLQRPDLMEALQEFCKMLGKQMEGLAATKDAPPSPQIPHDLPEHEKELVKRVLANPEIQTVLADPRIQKFLADIRQNPPLLTKAMFHPDFKDLQPKIQILIKYGFLQVQQ